MLIQKDGTGYFAALNMSYIGTDDDKKNAHYF